MSLPYDISGSRTKNRFRLELMWGISKMLDIFDYADFTMVFDYVCDIELHTGEGFEFYQIKTHKGNKTNSIKGIVQQKKGHSILGKLFVLKNSNSDIAVKLAIVSNSQLKDNKRTVSDAEEIELTEISISSKEMICSALKEELSVPEIQLENVFYIYTPMNLVDPQNELLGKLVIAFNTIEECEIKKPITLYRLIYDSVSRKACYEFTEDNYEELVNKKGMKKAELKQLFDCHRDVADNAVENTKMYINALPDYRIRRTMNAALARILASLQESKQLRQIEHEIGDYLITTDEASMLPASFEDCIEQIVEKFKEHFTIEFSKDDIRIFIVLILKRFEEGVYDGK